MKKLPKGFLHGADYNPDQWLAYPEILAEDCRLMPLAHTNVMSIGIFSWSALEPEEGRFEFGWLDEVFDRLHATGQSVILATPGGARPAWMAQKYPEVLRVGKNRVRNLFGHRDNHCLTSPVFREKCGIINARPAASFPASQFDRGVVSILQDDRFWQLACGFFKGHKLSLVGSCRAMDEEINKTRLCGCEVGDGENFGCIR
jgi:hypothetical protein